MSVPRMRARSSSSARRAACAKRCTTTASVAASSPDAVPALHTRSGAPRAHTLGHAARAHAHRDATPNAFVLVIGAAKAAALSHEVEQRAPRAVGVGGDREIRV